MRTMKDKIVPQVLRFMKSVRLQRGGGWRAVRVGVVAVVVVVWVWVYFVSPPTHTPPPLTHGDWSSGSPNLQVAAPIREGGGGGGGGEGIDKIDTIETWRRSNIKIENKIHPVKVDDEEERVEKRGERGGRILIEEEEEKSNKKVNKAKKKIEEEEEQEQETNPRYNNRLRGSNLGLGKDFRDKQIFPNIFPKRRLILPGDTKLLEEEDEDEEEEEEEGEVQEEEEGKWKGRNKEENDNHAMEEEDDVVGIGDKNDKNNDDDFVEEDVGGEAIQRKRRRREKPRRRKMEDNNNNNKDKNNIENKNTVDDPQKKPKNDLKENRNQGQRSNKEVNDPSDPLHELRDLDLVAVEEEMRQRRSKVKQVCARYGLGPSAPPGALRKVKYPPTPTYEAFYIDRGDRLAWCPVYKAASTSWLYGFLGLAGISESYVKNTKEQVSTVARRVWPSLPYDAAKEAVSTCVKAMVVRHPFERLVSAFRDKLEKVAGGEIHGTEHFYQKYGKKIVEKYRNKDEVEGNAGGRGRDRENQRNIDAREWKSDEIGRLIDVRGGISDGVERNMRVRGKKDEIRGKKEAWGKNDLGTREADVNKGNRKNLGPPPPPPPPPPPLRYSNALDDTDPHQPPPPPTPPPPPPARYKHILADTPPPPPPQPLPHSPPIRFPDEFDDPHQPPPPPPQRYKHILVDDSPPPQGEPENSPKQGKEPTFREFVRYLIDTDLTLYADDHWMPYHLSCTPCLLDFDVIAKFETLNRDQAFLLRKTNLQGKLNFSWRHLTKGNKTKDVVKRYFADVPRKDLLSLFKKYRLDFEMFDYSVDEYLNYVKSD